MVKLQKLKSLIKLNKLFRYKFYIPVDLFYGLKIKSFYISKNDNMIVCYGNKALFKVLSLYEVEYVDQYKYFIKNVFFKRIILFLSFICVILIFLSSSRFIREVKFSDESMYDYRVYSYVYSKLNKKMYVYTLKEDLNSLSLSLRAAFPNYSYIGIKRSGSCLIIDIEKIKIKKEYNSRTNQAKLVSNYNAVIYSIKCDSGVVLVNLNQSVKIGDVLVEPNKEGSHSDALILGNFSKYEIIKVKKEKIVFEFTGKMMVERIIKVGKNYLMNFKDYYEEQEIKLENKIKISNLVSLYKVYYFEKDYLLVQYDYLTAYNYAESLIYLNLELFRKSTDEKINDLKFIKYIENEDEYVFYFLVNYTRSIGVYID